LDIVLKDVPGQLVKALEPISAHGGNIISIVHLRETITGGRVPVHVTFEVEDDKKLSNILEELENKDIWVSKLGEIKKKEKITAVLIGHIVDTDLRDTVDRINEVEGAMVADVSLSMPHPEKESSAKIDIEVIGEAKEKALQRLEQIASEKSLFVIKSLGV
jgi:ACT domain-containing protein